MDWHDIARIADAVTERGAKRLSEGQATGGAQIACSRALHLRRALMAHHLEALPLEEAGVWDAVGDLIVRCLCQVCHVDIAFTRLSSLRLQLMSKTGLYTDSFRAASRPSDGYLVSCRVWA